MDKITIRYMQTALRMLPRAILLGLLVMLSTGSCGSGGDPAGGMVSGRVVVDGGAGLAGVTITASGSSSGCASYTATTTTDADGYYLFYTGEDSGSGYLTPSKTGYTFTPSSRDVSVSSSDALRDQDFLATAGTGT
jgi:hypothetical protein